MAKILNGGPFPHNKAFECTSLGELFLNRLNELGENEILIDAVTYETITAAQLRSRSIKFSRALQNVGVTSNDRIFICSEDRMEFAYVILGAIYIGAAVALVEPDYGEIQISHSINDARPKIAFCSKISIDKVRIIAKTSDCLEKIILFGDNWGYDDHDDKVISSERFLNQTKFDETNDFQCKPVNMFETTAIILRTSGTTSLPKSILVTQRNLLLAVVHYVPIPTISEPIIFSVVPWVRGIGLKMLLRHILNNVKTVFVPNFRKELEIYRTVEAHKANIICIHPAFMSLLATSPTFDKFDLSSIRIFYCGGSALKKEINDAVLKRLPNAITLGIYGMVELSYVIQQKDDSNFKDDSVGVLQPGVFGKVINVDTGEMLAPNMHGELCFKGEVVMNGYIGIDDQSSSFIDDNGWFHTGDIGYYDEDEDWFVVGRIKDLINYNGRKISPSFIENILVQHPKIMEAGIIGVQTKCLKEVPVAFIVKDENAEISEEDIRDFLLEKSLSQEIRLERVIFVKKLPKSMIGKLLRNFLREYYSGKPISQDIEKISPFYVKWYNNNFN